MPAALLKSCAGIGCPNLVVKGKCQSCARQYERQRVTNRKAASGGVDLYNTARWRQLRELFRRRLCEAGILPACGARLPGAQLTTDSTCEPETMDDGHHQQRWGERLHVDHIVDHAGDERAFADLMGLQMLCRPDHSRKTMREGR